MKAAVVDAVGEPFVIQEIDIAEPIGREVLVDVKASGLCHSDEHYRANDFGMPMPMVFGHEIAGVIAAVGPDVSEFKVGDHVVACLVPSCGHCPSCLDGRRHQCSNPTAVQRGVDEPPRLSRNGEPLNQFLEISGFAEQILTHENQVVAVNPEIPFDKAALLGCGVVTGAGAAINAARVGVGQDVVVIGCGGVGLNTVQGARLAGARRIIAIDLQPAKLELAKKFGATHTINSGEVDDVVAAVQEITGTSGVHASFEVIGLKATAELAVRVLGVGGTAYLVGMQRVGTVLDIEPISELMPFQRSIEGVVMGSTNFKRDVPMFADYYLQGRFNLDDLVSQTITLDEINEGYEELKGGAIARSVIVFD